MLSGPWPCARRRNTVCSAPVGLGVFEPVTQGVALGWHVVGPLALRPSRRFRLVGGPSCWHSTVENFSATCHHSAMPQSLARVVLHVVFSTKNRVPFLRETEVRVRLHAYMAGVLQHIGCEPILINGVEDHVHILCNLSRTVTIAGLVEEAKKSTSKWMKERGPQYGDFFWQGGYGAFSVSQSNVETVRIYIATQEEHHRTVSFQDELRALCRKHGVEIDERYVWD